MVKNVRERITHESNERERLWRAIYRDCATRTDAGLFTLKSIDSSLLDEPASSGRGNRRRYLTYQFYEFKPSILIACQITNEPQDAGTLDSVNDAAVFAHTASSPSRMGV